MNPTTDDFNGFSINIFQDEEGDWIAYLVEMPRFPLLLIALKQHSIN